jgi:hypothetical protein
MSKYKRPHRYIFDMNCVYVTLLVLAALKFQKQYEKKYLQHYELLPLLCQRYSFKCWSNVAVTITANVLAGLLASFHLVR